MQWEEVILNEGITWFMYLRGSFWGQYLEDSTYLVSEVIFM